MKKTLAAASAALLLLAGCSPTAQEDANKVENAVDEGDAAAETKLVGEATYDSGEKVNATIVKEGDKIADVLIETIDQDGNAITQLDQMADPTAQDTAIGTEYQEQVDYLENYIKENGVENITTDENGRVQDEEMLKNVDINVAPMLQAVKNALANETGD